MQRPVAYVTITDAAAMFQSRQHVEMALISTQGNFASHPCDLTSPHLRVLDVALMGLTSIRGSLADLFDRGN